MTVAGKTQVESEIGEIAAKKQCFNRCEMILIPGHIRATPQIEQICASGLRAAQDILFIHPTVKADLCER
jgi:hypothetical protein